MTTIFGTGAALETIPGTSGDDLIYGGANASITGTGRDVINGYGGNDVVFAADGNDTISGGDADDTVYGGDPTFVVEDEDRIFGDAGNDHLYGSRGNDFIAGDIGNDFVDGSFGNDVLYGDAGNDSVSGGDHNDVVYGGAGNDVLDGGFNDDMLFPGDGNDTVYGGGQFDTVIFEDLAGVTVTLGASGGSDTVLNVEAVVGGAGADLLVGNSTAHILIGGDGNDRLEEPSPSVGQVIYGAGGDDTLTIGTLGGVLAYGGSGRDTLYGVDDNDLLAGGNDNDVIYGAGSAWVAPGEGDDFLYGGRALWYRDVPGGVTVDFAADTARGAGLDVFIGVTVFGTFESEVEDVFGSPGNDLLYGEPNGSHHFNPGPGNDTVVGTTTQTWMEELVLLRDSTDSAAPNVVVDVPAGTASGFGIDSFTAIEIFRTDDGNDTLYGGDSTINDGSVSSVFTSVASESVSSGGGNDLVYGNGGMAGETGSLAVAATI
jgi:Ca2+-binding RTX toxin-like protein